LGDLAESPDLLVHSDEVIQDTEIESQGETVLSNGVQTVGDAFSDLSPSTQNSAFAHFEPLEQELRQLQDVQTVSSPIISTPLSSLLYEPQCLLPLESEEEATLLRHFVLHLAPLV
jgi:hypothetical protein